jgi:threonine dehydratase
MALIDHRENARRTFATVLEDKPRQLKKLPDILADGGANILAVQHERESGGMHVGKCVVGLKPETRGRGHIEQMAHALQQRGYRVYFRDRNMTDSDSR